MIRTSWHKNAGSRRNKKHKTVGSHLREYGPAIFLKDALKSPYYGHDFRSKPNHEARTAKISDCYPLADEQNLIPWKKDGVVVKLPRKEKVHGNSRP